MSSEHFRADSTNPHASNALVNATIYSPYIVYNYKPIHLVIPYVAAVQCSGIIVLVAAAVLCPTGRSYSTDFSTIMRTTRSPAIDALVIWKDRDGQDPVAESSCEPCT